MEALKKCTRCGEEKPLSEFTKSHGKPGSWCKSCQALKSREWRDKKRGSYSSRQYVTAAEIEQWRQCVAETGIITQTAARFGVASPTVQRYTHDVLQKYKSERNAKILELRQNGMTMEEIAIALNTTEGIVSNICRANECGGVIRSGWDRERTEAQLLGIEKAHQKAIAQGESHYRELLESLGAEYLGGYTHSDGSVNVRYPQCGHEAVLSCITLRQRKTMIPCSACAEEQRKRKEVERAEQKVIKREEKRQARMIAEEEKAREREQRRWKECKECGKTFYDDSYSGSKVYCCDACSNKSQNRKKEAKRRGYKSKISLTKLYKRDNGRCYICGCSCDYEDHQVIGGAFVVGPSYPTVEHVIPLCKGGTDSWDNVKLACHSCNSKKGRTSYYKFEESGQIAFAL